MPLLGRFLRVVGIAFVLMGLLWTGQGLGLIHWPQSSFMLDQRPWAIRGAGMAIIGLVFVLAGRRIR